MSQNGVFTGGAKFYMEANDLMGSKEKLAANNVTLSRQPNISLKNLSLKMQYVCDGDQQKMDYIEEIHAKNFNVEGIMNLPKNSHGCFR